MTYSWNPIKSGEEKFKAMTNHKIVHVVEDKGLAENGCYCRWHGELDNDKYFSVQVLDGIVMASMVDRETELMFDTMPMYYVKEMEPTVKDSTEFGRFAGLMKQKAHFLPKFTKELQFNEIMQLFMWEYVSTDVEIYENMTV